MIVFKPLDNSQIESMLILTKEFYSIDKYPFNLKISEKLLLEFINNTDLGKAWLIIYNGEI